MPLYAVLAREYFGQHIMGTVFGAATMTSAIGMAFGPVAGGWIFDTFDAYSWLFIGSAAVGLGAVAIALAFPPLPSSQRPACAAGMNKSRGRPLSRCEPLGKPRRARREFEGVPGGDVTREREGPRPC